MSWLTGCSLNTITCLLSPVEFYAYQELVLVLCKILQARLQQHINHELPDVQAGFRKGRGTRDQIANIHWIIEKARVPGKHLFLLY